MTKKCYACGRLIPVTKGGKLFRHERLTGAGKLTTFVREKCPGSGQRPWPVREA